MSERKHQLNTERKHLRTLTGEVAAFLALVDAEMKKPSTPERGRTIARLCNALDMANDQAMHFGLGMGFTAIRKVKARPAPPATPGPA